MTSFTNHPYHLPSPSLILKKRDMLTIFEEEKCFQLPPIHQFLATPPFETCSPISSIASSPTPEEEVVEDYPRKGSIASILNSDSYPVAVDNTAVKKRGRPKQELFEVNKKHRQYSSNTNNTRAIKGLRHFSKQVCDKVAEKGITTYNEVTLHTI